MEEAFSFDGRTLRKGRMVGISECSFSGEFRSSRKISDTDRQAKMCQLFFYYSLCYPPGDRRRDGSEGDIQRCKFMRNLTDSLHAFLFYAIMGCMSIGSGGKSGKRIGKAPVIVREVFQNFSL